VIVQRVLSARDEGHAKAGTIFAGFLKILPVSCSFFGHHCLCAVSGSGGKNPISLTPRWSSISYRSASLAWLWRRCLQRSWRDEFGVQLGFHARNSRFLQEASSASF